MARAIDKRIMLDIIIEAKKTDPETGPFSEWLAEYLVDHLPTLIQQNGPLTQADLDGMDYDKVWLDYGDEGEWALVVNGRICSLAALEGAGFEDILRDEVGGETMDRPSGDYTVYRRPPEGGSNETK